MQRKALILALLGVSAAGVAATQTPIFKVVREPIQPVIDKRPPVKAAIVVPMAAAVQPMVQPRPAPVDPRIASEVARWNSLRQADNLPFSSFASFLVNNRGWPGETALRRSAERQLDTGSASPSEIVRFFSVHPPLSATGRAHYALALQATGQPNEARTQARQAWTAGALSSLVESRLLGAFGSGFTQADHDERTDALLAARDRSSAVRMLPMVSPARRPVFEARLALQTRAPDAAARVSALGAAGAGDPGLLMDRAAYLREANNSFGARQLLAQRRTLASRPKDPAKFMETMVTMAQGAANDRQWPTAFQIASQVDDIYPQGTNVSRLSFAERDEYTNLTWLAGTVALQRLARPADAIGMFERYGRAAQSPQTRTKGLYWAGRAAQAAGQAERAQTYWREAARDYDQFYGQLSAERLGQPIALPAQPQVAEAGAAERQAFYNQPLVAATRYLGQNGSWRDQTEFIRALATEVDTDSERMMAAQLGRDMGRPDLGVLVARAARNAGSLTFGRYGFPEVSVPPAQARLWPLVHGIMRQESLFDRQALSSAGARGLMQLMPGTAREVAGRLGVGYDQSRLIDPQYNVMLGSSYFERLLGEWSGSYPLAIASYNAGPGNVRRWVRENGDPRTPGVNMVDWIEQIPFFETRNYVQRVLENTVVYEMMNPSRARSPERNRLTYYLGQPGRSG